MRRIDPRRALFGALLPAILSAGCGASGLMEAAHAGDRARLRREISLAREASELDTTAARDLARAVLSRDLQIAKGEQAVQLVRSISACAAEIVPALRARAGRDDDAAVEATVALLDARALGPDTVLEASGIAHRRWRIAQARAHVRPAEHDRRRRLLTDPDERVRRAALRAAIEAPDPDDVEALLEVVRLDPDPTSRQLGARALGTLGGARGVLGLRDRWATSDNGTRLAIVEAWAMPRAAAAGGVRELEWVALEQQSRAAVAAAAALASMQGASDRERGRALLARYIVEGTSAERRAAMQSAAPSDDRVRKALEKTADDKASDLRWVALGHLARHRQTRDLGLRRLKTIARQPGGASAAAWRELVRAGDRSAVPMVRQQLDKGRASTRRAAALALIEGGELGDAAEALADVEVGVRAQAACSMLARRR